MALNPSELQGLDHGRLIADHQRVVVNNRKSIREEADIRRTVNTGIGVAALSALPLLASNTVLDTQATQQVADTAAAAIGGAGAALIYSTALRRPRRREDEWGMEGQLRCAGVTPPNPEAGREFYLDENGTIALPPDGSARPNWTIRLASECNQKTPDKPAR